jgi:putative nucleotidyltransferase with HDIG domain
MLPLLLNSPPIKAAYAIAKKNRQEFYLVGGVLRDLHVKGTISEDIDFLVERDVASIAGQFAQTCGGSCFCLDDDRGNYRAVIRDKGTYHTVDFAPLLENQIIIDLLNRDFTINALALRLRDIFETGELAFIDPTGGNDDLQRKSIRMCSPHAFEDDPVRLLRAARFSQQCHFTIEPETERLVRETKERLLSCSWERIRNEFFLILNQPGATTALKLLDRLELLSILLPEIDGMRGMDQGSHHAYTLFEHALRTVECMEIILLDPERFFPRHRIVLQNFFAQAVEGAIPGRALAMFIALLHDIGKPSTCKKHDGEIHFYGHEGVGMEIACQMAARFKLARKTEIIVKKAMQQHMRPLQLQLLQRVTDRARYRLIRDLDGAVLFILILALADAMATRDENAADPKSIPIHAVIADVLDFYYSNRPDKGEIALLSGNEIMEVLQLKPGKQVGAIIEEIKEAERQGLISTKEEALKLIIGQCKEGRP